jgi:hypothetical protein
MGLPAHDCRIAPPSSPTYLRTSAQAGRLPLPGSRLLPSSGSSQAFLVAAQLLCFKLAGDIVEEVTQRVLGDPEADDVIQKAAEKA